MIVKQCMLAIVFDVGVFLRMKARTGLLYPFLKNE